MEYKTEEIMQVSAVEYCNTAVLSVFKEGATKHQHSSYLGLLKWFRLLSKEGKHRLGNLISL